MKENTSLSAASPLYVTTSAIQVFNSCKHGGRSWGRGWAPPTPMMHPPLQADNHAQRRKWPSLPPRILQRSPSGTLAPFPAVNCLHRIRLPRWGTCCIAAARSFWFLPFSLGTYPSPPPQKTVLQERLWSHCFSFHPPQPHGPCTGAPAAGARCSRTCAKVGMGAEGGRKAWGALRTLTSCLRAAPTACSPSRAASGSQVVALWQHGRQ